MPDVHGKKTEIIFSLKSMYVSCVLFCIITFILSTIVYYLIWGGLPLTEYFITTTLKPFLRIIVFVLLVIIGLGIHEIIHGIGCVLYGKVPWNKIDFGVNWSMMAPYTHCSVPIKVNQYKKILLLPGVLIGMIPFAIGLALEQFLMYFWGIIFILGAYGDFYVFWRLRKISSQAYIEDYPEKFGCYIVEK